MTVRAPDLTDQNAIRQAVTFGRQAAIREAVDTLHTERDKRSYWGGRQHSIAVRLGLAIAIDVVKALRIDNTQDPE